MQGFKLEHLEIGTKCDRVGIISLLVRCTYFNLLGPVCINHAIRVRAL